MVDDSYTQGANMPTQEQIISGIFIGFSIATLITLGILILFDGETNSF